MAPAQRPDVKRARPQWQLDLLEEETWGRDQFIGALCGEPLEEDQEGVDDWSAEQIRAATIVQRSIRAGALTVQFSRAKTQDDPFGMYDVRRDDAIRWAAQRPRLFPRFPFTLADVREEPAGQDTEQLPERLKHVLGIVRANAGRSQKEITALLQSTLKIKQRTAEAWAALCRPDDAVQADRRASRRRP